MSLSFSSIDFLSMKGFRFSSCLERGVLICFGIEGESRIRWSGVLGLSWCLMVLEPILSLWRSLTEGQKKLRKSLHSWV